MNLDAILPLLLRGQNNADMLKILTALKCGDKSKVLEAMLPKNKNSDTIIDLMKMANKKPPPAGLGAIEGFASNEILGMLVKYYA